MLLSLSLTCDIHEYISKVALLIQGTGCFPIDSVLHTFLLSIAVVRSGEKGGLHEKAGVGSKVVLRSKE